MTPDLVWSLGRVPHTESKSGLSRDTTVQFLSDSVILESCGDGEEYGEGVPHVYEGREVSTAGASFEFCDPALCVGGYPRPVSTEAGTGRLEVPDHPSFVVRSS